MKHGTICSLPNDKYGYFGWPSVIEHDGLFVVVASGFRKSHFGAGDNGRIVLFTSKDGEDWSEPRVIADTDRDDRDAGIVWDGHKYIVNWMTKPHSAFTMISTDLVQWLAHREQSITSPHGPTIDKDGHVIYLGKEPGVPAVRRYVVLYRDGVKMGTVPGTLNMNEAHVIQLDDGRLLGAMRDNDDFSVAFTQSVDEGKTWSKPTRMFDGSPPHLLKHPKGIICTYGYRKEPFGIRANSGGMDVILRDDGFDRDLGYPASCLIGDDVLTVYYMRLNEGDKCGLFYTIWSP